MKILFADKFPASHMEALRDAGHECVSEPDLGGDDLPARIGGFDALVVRSTKVTAAIIEAADVLKLIIRAGAGTNTIDKEAAAAKDIYVCNVPGKNAVAVAELTLGLILAIDRNIPDNVRDLRKGRWDKKRYSTTEGLMGRSLGIVGLGAIGLAVAERAAAFGLQVHVISKPGRSPDTESALERLGVTQVDTLEQLVERCDILSLHVPAAQETKGLVNAGLLGRMKEGAVLINTSRGDVIDEAALIEAMDTRGVRAGLDVYQDEPGSGQGEFSSALARHPGVYGTHHIGASTEQAQNAVAGGVVEIVTAFGDGEVLHCVNR